MAYAFKDIFTLRLVPKLKPWNPRRERERGEEKKKNVKKRGMFTSSKPDLKNGRNRQIRY